MKPSPLCLTSQWPLVFQTPGCSGASPAQLSRLPAPRPGRPRVLPRLRLLITSCQRPGPGLGEPPATVASLVCPVSAWVQVSFSFGFFHFLNLRIDVFHPFGGGPGVLVLNFVFPLFSLPSGTPAPCLLGPLVWSCLCLSFVLSS